ASWISELAPPDQNWSGQQGAKEQKDQDQWFRRNPDVTGYANETYDDPDHRGYAAGLPAAHTKSGQQQKDDEPQQTHKDARERRIEENRVSQTSSDLATPKRPPKSGDVNEAVKNSDPKQKQSGDDRRAGRGDFSIHVFLLIAISTSTRMVPI
ncbi:MAG: hypothetical protein ABI923_03270, partial [bacterium]